MSETSHQHHDHGAAHHHHGCGDEGHAHSGLGHSHLSHASTRQRLAASLGLTIAVLAAELAGGFLSHSLALLSDAAHMVTDVAALGLAWYAQAQAARPPSRLRTYGYHRSGIMAALANSLSLMAISGLIGWEAWIRIRGTAPHIDAPIMFGVAGVALAANLGIARLLSHGQSKSENLNVRAALLHVIGDAAASAGVLIGGIIIALRPDWWAVDPLLSFGIAAVIVWGAWRLLVEVVNVLMEGTPTGITLEDVERCMMTIEGVHAVHHVHVWAITPGINALSGHVVIDDQSLSTAELIRRRVLEVLKREYDVDHATLQMEHEACGAVCTLHHSASREVS